MTRSSACTQPVSSRPMTVLKPTPSTSAGERTWPAALNSARQASIASP